MSESVLYQSSSLIVYSSGLSRLLKRRLPESSHSTTKGDSNKRKCQVYRSRRKAESVVDPTIEFATL